MAAKDVFEGRRFIMDDGDEGILLKHVGYGYYETAVDGVHEHLIFRLQEMIYWSFAPRSNMNDAEWAQFKRTRAEDDSPGEPPTIKLAAFLARRHAHKIADLH